MNNINNHKDNIKAITEAFKDVNTIMKLKELEEDYIYINNLINLYLDVKLLRRDGVEKFPKTSVNQIITKYEEQIKIISNYYGITYEKLIIDRELYTDQEFIKCLHIRYVLEKLRNKICNDIFKEKISPKILEELESEIKNNY